MKVPVELGDRRYDVTIEDGARTQVAAVIAERAPRAAAAVVVTTAEVKRQPWFDVACGVPSVVTTIPDGEASKTLHQVESLCDAFGAQGLSRHDVVVAVGGGAVTDVAGLAAALFHRGVGVVHVPTSLVGQVDAAIGGKTAVNLGRGKNLVGAVHQPLGVLCDLEVLATLPERERRSGLGEVAKCWLIEGRDAAQLRRSALMDQVECAVGLKARLVAADEFDTGERHLLNYGHTLGHALEAANFSDNDRDPDGLRHGEAVAIGVAFAVRLARALGLVGDDTVAGHDEVLTALDLPQRLPPRADLDALVELMRRDKKAHHNLAFVLATGSGFRTLSDVDPTVVRRTLGDFAELP